MPEWKTAEKLKQPELTEVVGEAPAVIVAEAENFEQSESEIQHPPELPERPSFPETPPELGERYDILDFVGSGGMGSVWKVYDKTLGETFAIKVLNSDLIADATAVKRFEKEAKLASDLTHANIAAIFGPGADSAGRPYIIMKYVDGESLADIMAREGKFSEERAIDIFTQICEALQHSHMKGVIHRDIKPSNIIISKTESGGDMVHVVDFGIARCIHEEVTKTQALTKAVDVLGSPRYMSPEQLLGKEVTAQSDIYSLGCVFYEMLTGAPPFTDENPVRLILQHISEQVDFRSIPEDLYLVVSGMLGKEPAARFANVDRLLEVLSQKRIIAASDKATISFCQILLSACLVFLSTLAISASPPPIQSAVTVLYFLSFAVLWLVVAWMNAENAGRTKEYRQLELNLLLSTGAIVAVDAFGSSPFHNLVWLFAPAVIAVIGFIVASDNMLNTYDQMIRNLMSWLMTRRSLLPPRCRRILINCLLFALSCFGIMTLALNGFITLCLTRVFVCFGTFPSSETSFLVAVPVIIAMTVIFAFLIPFGEFQRFQKRTVCWFLALQAGAIMLVAGGTLLWFNQAPLGYKQLNRQEVISLTKAAKAELKHIALEALEYPHTYFANEARLEACSNLFDDSSCKQEYRILLNQIINSPGEIDGAQMAIAIRNKIGCTRSLSSQIYKRKMITLALNYLDKAEHPKAGDIFKSFYWFLRGNRIQKSAIEIGFWANGCGDRSQVQRALMIATREPLDKRWAGDLAQLRNDIVARENWFRTSPN